MSSTFQSQAPVPPTVSSPAIWPVVKQFLSRRRVAISSFLFISIVVFEVASGQRPHDLFNLHDYATIVGLCLIACGLALRSWAVGILRKNDVLTTTGPYSLTRNPLYAGSFLMMFGFLTIVGDLKYCWLLIVPIAGLYMLKIFIEEQNLEAQFGEPWRAYARAIPRLFPYKVSRDVAAHWRLAKWIHSREYRAVLTTLVGLAALKVWHDYPLR